jgi:anti-anti-sigma factor
MEVRHLSVEVRLEGGIAVLDLVGEINGFAEEALNAAYAEAEATDPKTVLLNFERVDYINSTGIALIVGLLALLIVACSPATSASTTWRSSTSRASRTS